MHNVKTCVIGGSGAYKLLEEFKKSELPFENNQFGRPSAPISICEYQGIEFAFLQRHGKSHEFPAHKVPYTANIWALKQLGVDAILANFTCGSLQEHITPNSFLIPDQFFDRTKKRQDSFFDNELKHVGAAEPYCPTLRKVFAKAC
ncbi:MAG: MTAP family purine nucleoside phosphorylase, partial [Candidatus Micrarchaeota archaeon]